MSYEKGVRFVPAAQPLPDFDNPPVIEVVCGMQFKPLGSLLAPHLGLLWDRFTAEYPTCQEVAPLAAVIERLGDATTPSLEFAVSDVPPLPRVWFVHSR